VIFPAHFVVAYLAADHAFVNNHRIGRLPAGKFFGHLVWSTLVILAFTFDVLLKDTAGFMIFISFLLIHIFLDILRRYGVIHHILEILALGTAFIYTVLFKTRFESSYITPEFSMYLLGMLIVTAGWTFLFREMMEEGYKDSVGVSERLAIYIFAFAGMHFWVFISAIAGLAYRVGFEKKKDISWILSPLLGILLSYLWRMLF